MSLRIVEHAVVTHTGQVRRTNEDSHLSRPPLFVIADGMGGARAGEIASRLCVETFGERFAGETGTDPEETLRTMAEEANRRIFAMAREDAATSGMGTTVTAALLAEGSVAFGHVGDSRAYVYRDGVFQQLSDDHSYVGELVRRGALSPADAETHPQRSVITRVLGNEPEVDVDTWTVEPRAGDVFLLCSDGLSGMVGDDGMADILDVRPSLADAGRELVRAANAAGGADNITAVLFRVGDETTPSAAVAEVTEEAPHEHVRYDDPEPPRPGRALFRRVAATLLLVAVVAAVGVGALLGLSWAHFVGAEPDGRVAVYQGVPFEIGWGVRLYKRVEVSAVPAATLTQAQRRDLFDHRLQSDDDALRELARITDGRPWERRSGA